METRLPRPISFPPPSPAIVLTQSRARCSIPTNLHHLVQLSARHLFAERQGKKGRRRETPPRSSRTKRPYLARNNGRTTLHPIPRRRHGQHRHLLLRGPRFLLHKHRCVSILQVMQLPIEHRNPCGVCHHLLPRRSTRLAQSHSVRDGQNRRLEL